MELCSKESGVYMLRTSSGMFFKLMPEMFNRPYLRPVSIRAPSAVTGTIKLDMSFKPTVSPPSLTSLAAVFPSRSCTCLRAAFACAICNLSAADEAHFASVAVVVPLDGKRLTAGRAPRLLSAVAILGLGTTCADGMRELKLDDGLARAEARPDVLKAEAGRGVGKGGIVNAVEVLLEVDAADVGRIVSGVGSGLVAGADSRATDAACLALSGGLTGVAAIFVICKLETLLAGGRIAPGVVLAAVEVFSGDEGRGNAVRRTEP